MEKKDLTIGDVFSWNLVPNQHSQGWDYRFMITPNANQTKPYNILFLKESHKSYDDARWEMLCSVYGTPVSEIDDLKQLKTHPYRSTTIHYLGYGVKHLSDSPTDENRIDKEYAPKGLVNKEDK